MYVVRPQSVRQYFDYSGMSYGRGKTRGIAICKNLLVLNEQKDIFSRISVLAKRLAKEKEDQLNFRKKKKTTKKTKNKKKVIRPKLDDMCDAVLQAWYAYSENIFVDSSVVVPSINIEIERI